MAFIYCRTKEYAKAEVKFNQALEIFESELGPDHPSIAVILLTMAKLYRATDRAVEAGSLENRAAQIAAISR